MNSHWVIDVTASEFEEALQGDNENQLVLVDFWAPWCAPCQALMPILHRLVEQYQGDVKLLKVNADEEQFLCASMNVRSLPTVKIYREGECVDEFFGALPGSAIQKKLENLSVKEYQLQLQEADRLLEQGELDAALEVAALASETAPAKEWAVRLKYIDLLQKRGRFDEAASEINKIPMEFHRKPEVEQCAAAVDLAIQASAMPVSDIRDLEAQFEQEPSAKNAKALALGALSLGMTERALAVLTDLFKTDRQFENGFAQKTLVEIFKQQGNTPLVAEYRKQLHRLMH